MRASLPAHVRGGHRSSPQASSAGHLLGLVGALALRDVSTRYKHSFLGLYWALVNPFLTALIFAFVFGGILRVPLSAHVPYAVFLVVNLTFWSFFANSLTSATMSVMANAPLISKIYFPRLVLPTAAVLARMVDFLFSAAAAALFMLFYRIPVGWVLPAFLLPLAILLALALGCGYMVAALQVLYRDTAQIVGVVTMLWMYLSPVMYATSKLPQGVRVFVQLNPVAGVLEFVQAVVLQHRWTSLGPLTYSAVVSAVILTLGILLFRHVEDVFGEIM